MNMFDKQSLIRRLKELPFPEKEYGLTQMKKKLGGEKDLVDIALMDSTIGIFKGTEIMV